ncbi:MAG: hypothetical protein R6X02_22250 [Enhygromyxa sp.]
MSDTPPTSRAQRRRARIREQGLTGEFFLDKAFDFILIFVGLYAATAVQRCQDLSNERDEYVAMLGDFKVELQANREQEESIVKDLGPIVVGQTPPEIGAMRATFDAYFHELHEDEDVLHCLHEEFMVEGSALSKDTEAKQECHDLYQTFLDHHKQPDANFDFKPIVLTPFYRYEVWQMYLASGVRIFKNKDLARKIGEIYNNAKIVEKQVADIEATYNDTFMKQVGRTAATDAELAELVADEEAEHGLSPDKKRLLQHISELIKEEHYATKEVMIVLEMEVERMKSTVLLMREEIDLVTELIDEELARVDR